MTTTLCAWQALKCLSEAEYSVGDNKYCLLHSYEQRNLRWRWANAQMLAEIRQERTNKRQDAWAAIANQSTLDVPVQATQDQWVVEMDCGI